MSDTTKDAIVIERTFDAPTDLMWQLWTEPEHLKNWYGPVGFTISLAEMDLRVGGKRLICMEGEMPQGMMKIWTTGEFTEVSPSERLAYTDIPSNENGEEVLYEGEILRTLVTVSFEALGEQTKLVMAHAGLPAGDQGASEGWKQAVNKLADYAETILKGKK